MGAIALPSLAEQRLIGAYLDKLDTLITLHQREDSNKKRAKIIVLTLLSWWGVIS
jgi:restriction endonuclease S subunit